LPLEAGESRARWQALLTIVSDEVAGPFKDDLSQRLGIQPLEIKKTSCWVFAQKRQQVCGIPVTSKASFTARVVDQKVLYTFVHFDGT